MVSPAARRLRERIMSFLKDTLSRFPGIGRPVGHRELREMWIPGTRVVVWFRVSGDCLEIARFWHSAQDRQHATKLADER